MPSGRKPKRGAQISIAIERMHFEGGGTLPPRFFPLPNGQDIVRAFSDGPPRGRRRLAGVGGFGSRTTEATGTNGSLRFGRDDKMGALTRGGAGGKGC